MSSSDNIHPPPARATRRATAHLPTHTSPPACFITLRAIIRVSAVTLEHTTPRLREFSVRRFQPTIPASPVSFRRTQTTRPETAKLSTAVKNEKNSVLYFRVIIRARVHAQHGSCRSVEPLGRFDRFASLPRPPGISTETNAHTALYVQLS